jgi:hypothetical protein
VSWKRPERAVDIDVQHAQQSLLGDQRRDEGRTLVERSRSFRHVAQADRARAPRIVEPCRHAAQQRVGVLALRQQCAGDHRRVGALQNEQHAFRAGELGHRVDQEFLQPRHAADLVQAHAGLGEALERRAQVGFAGKMRGLPLDGQTPAARVRDPRQDDRPVRVHLVEIAAPQAFVAQRGDAFEQKRVGRFQRFAGLRVPAVRRQRAVVPPQHFGGRRHGVEAVSLAGAKEVDGTGRGRERRSRIADAEIGLGEPDAPTDRVTGLGAIAHTANGLLEVPHSCLDVAGRHFDAPTSHCERRVEEPVGECRVQRRSFVDALPPRRRVAQPRLDHGEDRQSIDHRARRVRAAEDLQRPQHHAARMPVQAKRRISQAQVIEDSGLRHNVPGRFVRGKRLAQPAQLRRVVVVHAVHHVQRGALAVSVAGGAGQRQSAGCLPFAVGRVSEIKLRDGHSMQCAAASDRVAKVTEQLFCSARVLEGRLYVDACAPAGFGEAEQARGDQRLAPAASGRGHCMGCSRDGGSFFAGQPLHEREAIPRLRIVCRRGAVRRDGDHRVRVLARARHLALCNEALSANVEQRQPKRVVVFHGRKRGRSDADGPRVLARPREVAGRGDRRLRRHRRRLGASRVTHASRRALLRQHETRP